MMTNLKLLLEHLLSEDIDEAAIAIEQAHNEKLAFYHVKISNGYIAILYKAIHLVEQMHAISYNDKKKSLKSEIIGANPFIAVVQYENYDNDYNKSDYNIAASAAESKYGPLAYDLVLSAIYPKYLVSDRKTVSNSAKKLWNYYFNNREDVEHVLLNKAENIDEFEYVVPEVGSGDILPVIEEYKSNKEASRINREYLYLYMQKAEAARDVSAIKKAEEKKHLYDARQAELKQKYKDWVLQNPLAYKYRISSPIEISALESNHRECMNDMSKIFTSISAGKIEKELIDAATYYYYQRIK